MRTYYRKKKLPDGSTRDEHRLIMERKLGRRLSENEIVHHIDGNPMNNDLSNLELMERSEHTRSHRKGRTMAVFTERERMAVIKRSGERSTLSKLTADQVSAIKSRLLVGDRTIDIARDYGVDRSTISKIKRGKSWKNVHF